jgi:hypothetical protein
MKDRSRQKFSRASAGNFTKMRPMGGATGGAPVYDRISEADRFGTDPLGLPLKLPKFPLRNRKTGLPRVVERSVD